MNKSELINKIAEKEDITKENVSKALDAAFNSLIDALKGGEKVALVGFGTLMVSERNSREGRNPRTGETISVPAMKIQSLFLVRF